MLFKIKSVSIFGLGKLGATTLAVYASKGYKIIGVDINQDNVNAINEGRSPIYEPGVDFLIKKHKENICATTDTKEAILNSDISFLIMPTPSNKDGSFSTNYVENALGSIGEALKTKEGHHTIVLVSTVCPGSTNDLIELLEDVSGKECNNNFSFLYSPDFIALGSIIHDILFPDMILVGESDIKAGNIFETFVKSIVDRNTPIHRMSIYNAELCKIAINSFLVMKINFANVISEICENMPTGDASRVLAAIGADTRINKKYLRPGLAAAGCCLPRDSRAFKYSSEKYSVTNTFSEISDTINNYQKSVRIPRLIINELNKSGSFTLSILGITYKPEVSVTEESVPVEVAKQLSKLGYIVKIFDPAGMEAAKKDLQGYDVKFCGSINECLAESKFCFVATEWNEFKNLKEEDFLKRMEENPIIFDAWGIWSDLEFSEKITYMQIGKSMDNLSTLLPFLQYEGKENAA
jgi:UDPglucose 6-dehydrogenase